MSNPYMPKQQGTTVDTFKIGINKVTLDFSALTTSRTLKFPDSNGSSNQVLTTDGSGNLSWTAKPSGTSPSASVGLVPVNGSASTFMRSDAAPALDQNIEPTWTGIHVFTNSVVFSANITLSLEALFNGKIRLGSVLTPTQLTTSQNNYDPTSLPNKNVVRLSASTPIDITGMVPNTGSSGNGRLILLINIGSSAITLKNQSASSDTQNRFAFGADKVLAADNSAWIYYDSTSQRWRSPI